MKKIIILLVFLSSTILTGCVTQTTYGPDYNKTYIYTDTTDELYSKRVDYLGYGLGGQGFGGYGMGGYGLVGYGGQAPGI